MVALLDDAGIKHRVEQLWAKVFESSNSIIKHARDYGFPGIEVIPSPNIHQILIHLQVFDALIDILLANASKIGELEYDEIRKLLNAKTQLVNMGRVATALKADNKDDFEAAVADLEKQAVF